MNPTKNLIRSFGLVFLLVAVASSFTAQEEKKLVERVNIIINPELAPVDLEQQPYFMPLCGTPVILEAKARFDQLSAENQSLLGYLSTVRDTIKAKTPLYYDTPGGKVRIHYAVTGVNAVDSATADIDLDGIPNYVEEVATVFDSVWTFEVDTLGYRPPYPDSLFPNSDGPLFDVYLVDLGTTYLGVTFPDTTVQPPGIGKAWRATAFIVMDNDYRLPPQYGYTRGKAMRVTAAHEFFHAIQFAYDAQEFEFTTQSPSSFRPYWYEMSSTWMEEVKYDVINDYYRYLPTTLRNPWLSFRTFSYDYTRPEAIFPYGQALWNVFITERYSDRNLVRVIWERCADSAGFNFFSAANQALATKSTDFLKTLREYRIWNYFTGSRARPGYYSEAVAYPMIENDSGLTDILLPASGMPRRQIQNMGAGYFRVPKQPDPRDTLYILLQPIGDYLVWNTAIIEIDTTGNLNFDSLISRFGFWFDSIPDWTKDSELVIIPTVSQYPPDMSIDSAIFQYIIATSLEPPTANAILDVLPNPFILPEDNNVLFRFAVAKATTVRLSIHTLTGEVLYDTAQVFSSGVPGLPSFQWNGRNPQGEYVASGIYLCRLKVGSLEKIKKVAIIRK